MSIKRVGVAEIAISFIKSGTKTIKGGLKVLFIGCILALFITYLQRLSQISIWEVPKEYIQTFSGVAVIGFTRKISRRMLIGQIDWLFLISAYTGVGVLLPANLKKIFATQG